MKSNVEDITNKVVYTKIYDALNYQNDFLIDNLINASQIFDVIDDEFYSMISEQYKDQLLNFASVMADSKGYMSLYLFSFVISSLKECINYSFDFVKCIKSFYNNTEEQNIIMMKSLDKILNFYYNNMHNSPLQYYTKYKLLYKFNIQQIQYITASIKVQTTNIKNNSNNFIIYFLLYYINFGFIEIGFSIFSGASK